MSYGWRRPAAALPVGAPAAAWPSRRRGSDAKCAGDEHTLVAGGALQPLAVARKASPSTRINLLCGSMIMGYLPAINEHIFERQSVEGEGRAGGRVHGAQEGQGRDAPLDLRSPTRPSQPDPTFAARPARSASIEENQLRTSGSSTFALSRLHFAWDQT
eukprot:gene10397-biopygen11928